MRSPVPGASTLCTLLTWSRTSCGQLVVNHTVGEILTSCGGEHFQADRVKRWGSAKNWARPGFEPGTSRTLSENHTARPTSLRYKWRNFCNFSKNFVLVKKFLDDATTLRSSQSKQHVNPVPLWRDRAAYEELRTVCPSTGWVARPLPRACTPQNSEGSASQEHGDKIFVVRVTNHKVYAQLSIRDSLPICKLIPK